MDYKLMVMVVFTAFVAELGDKSQVLAVLYASSKQASPWLVFIAVSIALVTATGIGVALGHYLSTFFTEKLLTWVSGFSFLGLGVMTLIRATQLT